MVTPERTASAERYEIGCDVHCRDGTCGALSLVVVNPVAGKLVHLIVSPLRGSESRLVPVGMARVTERGVELDCTVDEFHQMEPAVKTHFMPTQDPEQRWGYHDDEIVALPYFGLGPSGPSGLAAPEPVMMPRMSVEDRVPSDEVRIYRGDHVHCPDGNIGKVRGLVVDPADESVTHVLLDEGHLWGHKLVAIPMAAVTGIDGYGIAVRLSKHEIKDLPPVDVVSLA